MQQREICAVNENGESILLSYHNLCLPVSFFPTFPLLSSNLQYGYKAQMSSNSQKLSPPQARFSAANSGNFF